MRVLIFRLFIILILFTVFSCKQEKEASSNPLIHTKEYQQEELLVYNELVDQLLDSLGFAVTPDKGKLVFYLGDTLAGEGDWEGDKGLLEGDIQTRSFTISDLNNTKHKFVRATDTLRLQPGEAFTSRWLKFTRVRFDKDLAEGFLRVGVYCGNQCSWEGGFDIQKKDGRWQIIKRYTSPNS